MKGLRPYGIFVVPKLARGFDYVRVANEMRDQTCKFDAFLKQNPYSSRSEGELP